jgi:regulator of protease activity HflC (stomatin/prohibitin superfamily)
MIKRLAIGLILVTILIMVILNSSFDEVDYDKSAVITNRILGTTRVKQSGYMIKFPWDEVQMYMVMQDRLEQTLKVTDKQSKSFNITVIIYFSLKREQIDKLHGSYGKDYKLSILDSLSVLAIREITKKFTGLEVYSLKRAEVEIRLAEKLSELLEDNYINFGSSLISSVELTEDTK